MDENRSVDASQAPSGSFHGRQERRQALPNVRSQRPRLRRAAVRLAKIAKMRRVRSCGISQNVRVKVEKNRKNIQTKIANNCLFKFRAIVDIAGAARRPHADARLRGDARGRDGGFCKELAARIGRSLINANHAAPFHSITSSARAGSAGGTVMPSLCGTV